jgi:hypothetical protein
MGNDDRNAAFERIVTANLARAVDILRFAETKNAALLTFCSAWIIASVNMLKGGSTMSREYVVALTIALMLFAIAAMLSVWSIAPRLMHRVKGRAPERQRNLLFFGDVAPLEIADFKAQFIARYLPAEGHAISEAYIDDLMTQIAINSKIAERKMRFFHWSSRVAFLAITVLLAPPVWWALRGLFGAG